MSEARDSVFIRYRNGSLLLIEPNIKEKVSELIPTLEEDKDYAAAFRSIIKNIDDGNGAGIHPDSTWFNAARELYHTYERYDGNPVPENTQKALLGLFKLLAEGTPRTRLDWDKVRTYLIDNIADLSPMPERYLATFDGYEVKRDDDGTYYYDDEKDGRIEISGLKTPAEETLQFYTNDTQMKFGRLYRILHFVALFDISYEYLHSPSDFPEKLSCTLYDNNGDTNYLDWQWQMPTPFDFVPMQWHPRSPFSNPDWLGSDLVARLPFPNSEPNKPILPNPPSNESLKNWQEAFSAYKWQLELPLISNILVGEEPEEYFDFFDRKVRWVNGNAFVQPMLIVPCNDDDGNDGIEIARKFLSILNIEHEVALSEQLTSLQRLRYLPWFRQTRITVFQMINPDYAIPREDYTKYSKKKWYALAFMREAISSNSIYYSFLNYFKVIELANKGDLDKTRNWIDANIERVCKAKNIDWYEENMTKQGRTDAGFYLAKTERTAIAHAEYNFQGKNTHNPDDPKDWRRTRDDLVVIRELAKDILSTL